MTGLLSAAAIEAIRAKAEECDGPRRRTRCRSCATILTLLADRKLLAASHTSDPAIRVGFDTVTR